MSRADRPESFSDADPDGVRVYRLASRAPSSGQIAFGLAVLLLIVLALALWWRPPATNSPNTPSASGTVLTEAERQEVAPASASAPKAMSKPPSRTNPPNWAPVLPADQRSGDENDIASYVSPDDPEPSMAEVIEALRASGEHGGIAAFNPPGTSPPLLGLVVPEDYVLPEGYVRHHQVTDDGQRIEPILMFSPDHEFRDAAGELIPIPEDRVVTPELAPPDFPIQPVVIPPPQ